MRYLESVIATGWLYETNNTAYTYPYSINLNYSDDLGLYFPYSQSHFKFENKTTGLELKIKNDSILIDNNLGIYVNDDIFLYSSLITNSKTLTFNTENSNKSLEVCIDNKTIQSDAENKEIYVDTTGLYEMSFDKDNFILSSRNNKFI
jgi:hypothetical protein